MATGPLLTVDQLQERLGYAGEENTAQLLPGTYVVYLPDENPDFRAYLRPMDAHTTGRPDMNKYLLVRRCPDAWLSIQWGTVYRSSMRRKETDVDVDYPWTFGMSREGFEPTSFEVMLVYDGRTTHPCDVFTLSDSPTLGNVPEFRPDESWPRGSPGNFQSAERVHALVDGLLCSPSAFVLP